MRTTLRQGRRHRRRLAIVIVAAIGLGSRSALAFSTGITGVSGKQGSSCSACHSGGVTPTVQFEGPTQLGPGETGTFRFIVQSQSSKQSAAGLDVAASSGTLTAISGEGEQVLSGEIIHTQPKSNDANGAASWAFTWTAPAQEGTATLFGAGNSVNLNGAQTGDKSATTTYQIAVAAVAPPTDTPTFADTPTPTPTPTPPPSTCVGDCNGSGDVTVNEIINGVNIALGTADLATCPSFDANHDGQVTVNELLQAVNAALNGCPLP